MISQVGRAYQELVAVGSCDLQHVFLGGHVRKTGCFINLGHPVSISVIFPTQKGWGRGTLHGEARVFGLNL